MVEPCRVHKVPMALLIFGECCSASEQVNLFALLTDSATC